MAQIYGTLSSLKGSQQNIAGERYSLLGCGVVAETKIHAIF